MSASALIHRGLRNHRVPGSYDIPIQHRAATPGSEREATERANRRATLALFAGIVALAVTATHRAAGATHLHADRAQARAFPVDLRT
jgi:hypothetical protein